MDVYAFMNLKCLYCREICKDLSFLHYFLNILFIPFARLSLRQDTLISCESHVNIQIAISMGILRNIEG